MPASAPYIELHAHSAFSFLDGASAPEEMAGRAAELGYPAMAITDHDGLCGSLAFARAARAVDVRPITGAELTLDDGAHITLLVRSPRGYANLCRLITLAHAGTRPPPRREALPPRLDRTLLAHHSRGLVCLTGCAREGMIPASWHPGATMPRSRPCGSCCASSARATCAWRSSARAPAATGA